MLMDIDSQSLTPPGSPVLRFSGGRDIHQSVILMDSSSSAMHTDPIIMFDCRGPVMVNDTSFSPDEYFHQNTNVSSMSPGLLSSTDGSATHLNYVPGTSKCKLFGFPFDTITIEELDTLNRMCRKRIAAITNLERGHLTFCVPTTGRSGRVDTANFENAFAFRIEVCNYLNWLMQNRFSFPQSDLSCLFTGLIRSLGPVKKWSSSLMHHCGSGKGNQCTSPEYHLFHLNLELRWTLLVILQFKSEILYWIIQDLLHLALLKFRETDTSLDQTSPFNCYCVMEFWAMLEIWIDHLKPNEMTFLAFAKSAVLNLELPTSELLFPVWFFSHLAEGSKFRNSEEQNRSGFVVSEDTYSFVCEILKQWFSTNANAQPSKLVEIHSLLRRLQSRWGYDLNLITILLSYWLSRIEKGVEVPNVEPYSTSRKWIRLTTDICEAATRKDQSFEILSSSEPFYCFLVLLIEAIAQSTPKDRKKLSSTICSRLSPKVVEAFNEIRLTRVITMLLCMANVANIDVQTMCERLNEALNYAKDSLRLTKIRGCCTLVLLLLQKSISVGPFCKDLMTTVDGIMGSMHRSSCEKDIVIVYLDLIENLATVSPHLELDQSKLISVNLTPWLASCGTNYMTRTLRTLHSLFHSWLLNSEAAPTREKSEVADAIFQRTETFIQQTMTGILDTIDVEPLAEFAVDLTVFQMANRNYVWVRKFYQLFAISPRTSPKVSEIYVDRLIGHNQLESLDCTFISEIQLAQSWVRLVTVGASVPLSLTGKLLSPFTAIESTGPISSMLEGETLLRRFCAFVNSNECFWTRAQLTEILSPIGGTVKAMAEKACDGNSFTMESVVRTAVLVLKEIKMDKIYVRNSGSTLVHQILDGLVPSFLGKPPWEKLSSEFVEILVPALHMIFIFIASKDWMQDPFLRRKLCDTFRFAFLGFITTVELKDENPGLLIMQYVERMDFPPVPLLNELQKSLHQLTKEERLMKRLVLAALGFLKRRMTLTSVWLFPLVLEIMIENDNEVASKCSGILTNCIALALGDQNSTEFQPRLKDIFDSIMTKHFSFRSKRFFAFFTSLTSISRKKPVIRHFMLSEILPLISKQIFISEAKQGTGSHFAMRTQLNVLETNLRATKEN